MKILLTGATGLIGRALVAHWQSTHQLILLSRDPKRAGRLLGTNHPCVGQLSDVDFNQLDAVVNLAGEPIAAKRWTEAQKQRICQSRWLLTEQIAGAIQQASTAPSVLINGSAVGFYGRQGPEPISEQEVSFYPEFSHDVCARWENLANRAAGERTRVCLVRTGIVLSDKGGALSKMLLPFRMGLGGPIATGQQFMSWVHIEDMVALIDFLLHQNELNGPFNATAPRPVTNQQFSQLLAARLGKKAALRMPAFVVRALFGEMADLMLFGQNAQPQRLLQAGFQFRYPHLKEALAALQL
ncbi:TIGR01777 family oxidoreductase [Rheinheimera sp.]|uniref:TIGR01777 family oxidoreductase n=1 Tax=Rheinheimera sp. TaxID=1869214 RepID=UPI00307DD685